MTTVGVPRVQRLSKCEDPLNHLLLEDVGLLRPQFGLDQSQNRRHEEVVLGAFDDELEARFQGRNNGFDEREQRLGKSRKRADQVESLVETSQRARETLRVREEKIQLTVAVFTGIENLADRSAGLDRPVPNVAQRQLPRQFREPFLRR